MELIRWHPYERLSIFHPMRPEIASLFTPWIDPTGEHHPIIEDRPKIRGIDKSLYFLTHNYYEDEMLGSMQGHQNSFEAHFLLRLCQYLLLQGYYPRQITMLSPYSSQVSYLRKIRNELAVDNPTLREIRVVSVENFQQGNARIILLSLVRSNRENDIGCLKNESQVLVALSRARYGLYIVGNMNTLVMEESLLWKEIRLQLLKNQALGNQMVLHCENHPEQKTYVSRPEDFDPVLTGGCGKPCQAVLSCGHVCPLTCHTMNSDHKSYKCQQPYSRQLSCGHTLTQPCHVASYQSSASTSTARKSDFGCEGIAANIEGILDCQQSQNSCLMDIPDSFTVDCQVIVQCPVLPACGHGPVSIPCHLNQPDWNPGSDELLQFCVAPCWAVLPCGHVCPGTCNSCLQGRMHVPCDQPCDKLLFCGHRCKAACREMCPPCNEDAFTLCDHPHPPRKCSEPYKACSSPCEWSCVHLQCTRPCGEECDRSVCLERCCHELPCGHLCIGLCGEPHPHLCRICDKIFPFLLENKKVRRFVVFEDCPRRHVISSTILDEIITRVAGNSVPSLLVCPVCETPVVRTKYCRNLYIRFRKQLDYYMNGVCD